MLNIFKRLRHRTAGPDADRDLDGRGDRRLDEAFRIGDLLDHPALRAVMADAPTDPMTSDMIDEVGADAPVSLAWARLIAAGPIPFRPLRVDRGRRVNARSIEHHPSLGFDTAARRSNHR